MLVNQNNRIVNVNAQQFNVQYDPRSNEFTGKDARKFDLLRSRLREVHILKPEGNMFSIGVNARLIT